MLKNERNNPILPMKRLGVDISEAKVKKLNKSMADSAHKIVCIFGGEDQKGDPSISKKS